MGAIDTSTGFGDEPVSNWRGWIGKFFPLFRVVGLLWYGLYRLDIGINLVPQIIVVES